MGYTKNCEIWHGASLGTLIIQEESIWRTIWGPSFGHKRAIFWPFLGKWKMGYTQKCEIWHRAFPGIFIKIQEEKIWRAIWGPYFGHEGHILAISKKGGLWDTTRIVKFGMEHSLALWFWFKENQFEGPCEDHVLAIKGPYFGHF